MFTCNNCNKTVSSKSHLRRHIRYHCKGTDRESENEPQQKNYKMLIQRCAGETDRVLKCSLCNIIFKMGTEFVDHMQSQSHKEQSEQPLGDDVIEVARCFKERIFAFYVRSKPHRVADIPLFLNICKSRIKHNLSALSNIHFNCELFAVYVRPNEKFKTSLTTKYVNINADTNFDAVYDTMFATVKEKNEKYQKTKNGWKLESVSHMKVNVVENLAANGFLRDHLAMADVIELSSDEEELKEIRKENGDVIELTDAEHTSKRLRLSPFKSDIIVLLDEELDNENGVENNVNLNNVPENTTQKDDKVLFDKSSEVFDLTGATTSNADNKDKEEVIESTEDEGEEEEEEEESEKEGKKKSKEEYQVGESTSEFLDKCFECISENSVKDLFRTKVTIFKKVYNRATHYVASKEYEELIQSMLNRLEINPERAIMNFQSVFRALEDNYDRNCESDRLKRLEEMLTKLNKKLQQLEEAEVDFDEEENSNYMKMQRYRERAFEVYTKIKKIEKSDPNYGRPYYGRIDFAYSSYPEINRALNKKYQNREKRPFPTFEGVNKCIRKCVKENDLKIPEHKLKAEIKGCFEQLGNLLQKKRRIDLANVHMDYLGTLMDDPAKSDPELSRKLQENHRQYNDKMKQVLNKFERMQDEGVSVALSEDSDDSHAKNSDEEQSD